LGSDDVQGVLLDQPISVAPELSAFLLEVSTHEAKVDRRLRRREARRRHFAP
jgi:hypothetical protein